MFLDYGPVRLSIIDLTRFERDTVWTDDGTDLLYVRHTIGVTATYAPGGYPRLPSATEISSNTKAMLSTVGKLDTTAGVLRTAPRGLDPGTAAGAGIKNPKGTLEAELPGPGPVAPALWHSGPETDAELRGWLWTPRQKLVLWAYARGTGLPIEWLRSPRPGMAVDMNNGPRPLSLDVVSASGEPNSIAVHFQVQTDMSPCPVGSDRLVLSHRWEMTHGHDENYYMTRTIRGQIVFNSAVENVLGARSDFVRAQFIHPIPLGFKRSVPEISLSSDGNTMRYTVVDTDPTITFDPGNSGATQIQIVERIQMAANRGFSPAQRFD